MQKGQSVFLASLPSLALCFQPHSRPFCLTARVYLNTQKYGLFCSLLYCRRLHQALILLFNCLNGTVPTYIGSLFKYRHTPYRLRGEGLNLELPNFNLKFKKNSFTYSLAKLWNSLPSQVRLSRDANDFRSKLHDCSFLERVL